MRTMTTEKLLKGMPVLQTQIDTLLEFDVRVLYTYSLFQKSSFWWPEHGQPLLSLFRLLSGSSQGAEQRDHQCCIPASLQGPGQTVCIVQWRDHQPTRSVVHGHFTTDFSPSLLKNILLFLQTACSCPQRNSSRWRRVIVRRHWKSTRGSWPGWQRLGNSWSWLR